MSLHEIQKQSEARETRRIAKPSVAIIKAESPSYEQYRWAELGYPDPEAYKMVVRRKWRLRRRKEPLFRSRPPGGHKMIAEYKMPNTE